jgi:hypothetical protein
MNDHIVALCKGGADTVANMRWQTVADARACVPLPFGEITVSQKMLKAAGETLWGPQYRSEMARQLGLHLRTMMRWDAGERQVSEATLGAADQAADAAPRRDREAAGQGPGGI